MFSELINRVGFGHERIVLTRHGKPLVALVPASEVAGEGRGQGEGNVTMLDLSARPDPLRPSTGIAAQSTQHPQG